MSQRKKPPTPHQTQKIVAAQFRKEFFRKMKSIIDSVAGKDIFPLIPSYILDDVYSCRCAPFKFKIAYNNNVPNNIYNDSKVILTSLIKKHAFLLPPSNIQITLNDYFTVVLTIVILYSHVENANFDHAHKVKEALEKMANDNDTNEKANKELYNHLYFFNLGNSDLRENLYWYQYDYIPSKKFGIENENLITIHSDVPERINVEADGITRPAVRVGWGFAYSGPEWLNIKPADFGLKSPFAEIPLKVYIQTHALNRLSERIDCFWTGSIQFSMFISLTNPKIAYDNNKNLLIEYTFFGTKAGYFRADIVNGIILIRTFLFITNNGTPEGSLLENNTGLQKLDKKYLNIDKLSTFMNSDLDKNEEAQQLLKSCGCKCLIDLYTNMKPFLTKKDNDFKFNMMMNYLNANNINSQITNELTAI